MTTHAKMTRRTLLKGLAGGALALGWSRRLAAQTPLRISLPPLQDSLPLGFASTERLFDDAGLLVELVGISSRQERSAALLSNNLDGVLSDISTLLFNRGNASADVVITSTGFRVVDGSRQMALMASGFFNVEDIEALLRRIDDRPQNSITLSRRTDMELVTDELLASLGIQVNPDIHYADTDDLVNAATLLVGGSVLSAVLPEPLAIISEENELIDAQFLSKTMSSFETIALPPSIMVFRRQVVQQRQAEVALFYDVWRQAIEEINSGADDSVRESAIANSIALFLPGLARSELPDNFGDSYRIPEFSLPGELDQDTFERVAAWAASKDYLFAEVDFASALDYRFLTG